MTDRGPAHAGLRSRTRSWIVSLLVAIPAIAHGAVDPPVSGAPVAWIDGEPVTVADVMPHLEPAPPRVGLDPVADPRVTALEAALQLHLLDREARRRRAAGGASVGPPGSELARARRLRALKAAEAERLGLRADAIDPAEARAVYDGDCRRFHRVDEVEVAAIALRDSKLAERLLPQAAATDAESFARLAALHSEGLEDGWFHGTLPVISGDGDGADPAIARVALRMRHAGEVGLATLGAHHLVLRAVRVECRCLPWSPSVENRVRNLLAHERREEHFEAWAARLRDRSHVVVDRALLHRLPVPRWDDPERLE